MLGPVYVLQDGKGTDMILSFLVANLESKTQSFTIVHGVCKIINKQYLSEATELYF